MSLFKLFKMDEHLEKQGVPVEFGEKNIDGTFPIFYLARIGGSNKKYDRALDTAAKPYRRQIEMDLFSNEKADDLLKKVFVDTILLGWKNVFDEEEKPIEFNRENALKLFEMLPELYKALREEATKASNYRQAQMESDAKN